MPKQKLSKSMVLAGLQCEKRLYLEINHPELKDPFDDANYILEMGRQVGEFARTRYPMGILVDPGSLGKALKITKSLADQQGPPLFESTFRHSNILVRTDILHRGRKHRVLTEVKSASSVKDEHYDDCAVQAWVVEGAGYPLSRIELEHINSDFLYEEEGNYDGLLVAEDITDIVRARTRSLGSTIKHLKTLLTGPEPCIEMGTQCKGAYPCPFYMHCQSASVVPEYPVTELPHIGKLLSTLMDDGIVDIRDIPDEMLEKFKHRRMREAILKGEAILENEAVELMQGLPYPRYYLDFETILFAIPIWLETSPYQPLDFPHHRRHSRITTPFQLKLLWANVT